MAKTGTFQVWLVNQVDFGTTVTNSTGSYVWNGNVLYTLLDKLQSLFKQVCAHSASSFADANVSCNILAPDHQTTPTDLLVRITRCRASIVGRKQQITFSVDGPATGATLTVGPLLCISEVFLDPAASDADPGALLANLAFHECMHNKLETGPGAPFVDDDDSPKSIHKADGTGLAIGGVGLAIGRSTALSPTNARNMALHLKRLVKQFRGTVIP
jgi:hypothetical protein